MTITATKILAKDLKAGDLFSAVGQTYWDNYDNQHSVAQKVYVRTDEPCPENQAEDEIYLITINR